MITSERLNVGWWNLAVRCIVQQSRRVQRSRWPGTKNDKVQHFFGSGFLGRGPRGHCMWCMFGKTSLA